MERRQTTLKPNYFFFFLPFLLFLSFFLELNFSPV